MSFGSLSGPAKEALGRGATLAGTSTTTGDGGMTQEERGHSRLLVYQLLPSRYGMNPDDLRRADAIEIVVGEGAKPGGGGMLLGHKISDRVAAMRDLPAWDRPALGLPPSGLDRPGRPGDQDRRAPERSPTGGFRSYVKVGAARPYYDVALAVKAGADAIVLDRHAGRHGGDSQDVFIEHVGIPILSAIPQAKCSRSGRSGNAPRGLAEIVSGGDADRCGRTPKALALGANAVSIGVAALIALGDNSPT